MYTLFRKAGSPGKFHIQDEKFVNEVPYIALCGLMLDERAEDYTIEVHLVETLENFHLGPCKRCLTFSQKDANIEVLEASQVVFLDEEPDEVKPAKGRFV